MMMMINIEWDSCEVNYKEGFTIEELDARIEEVREELSLLQPQTNTGLEDLLDELTNMKEKIEDE